jgi:multiple sugar transport system ATP-binding protein
VAEIVLDQVSKRYPDGTVAVHALDLTVADGELMVLVGPSGCGKSTTLRMIAGLEQITEGELRIGGTVVNDLAPRKRDIAMVFQSYALYPHMSVARNIGFALRRDGLPKAEIRRRVEAAADLLGIADQLERKPAMLSGGQRQRVAMGRAIVREPQVFLLDEPLSNLDAKLRGQMRAEIGRIHRRVGAATVYVTHDQTEAMTLGDRIAVMRDGHLQQVGTPEELYDQPQNLFVAGFIGAPPMNFLTGTIDDGAVQMSLGRLPIEGALTSRLGSVQRGDRVIVGIRPEDFEGASGHPALTAVADVVESTGSDVFVHVGLPDEDATVSATGETAGLGLPSELVARYQARTQVRPGEQVRLGFDAQRVHLFDASSLERLAEPVEAHA